MNTNHNKTKSQFCYVSTAGPTSGSASLPDGSKMKSNSHLKLTSHESKTHLDVKSQN